MGNVNEGSTNSGKAVRSGVVAKMIGVTTQTLSAWRRRPDLNGLRFFRVGRQARYLPEDVEAWIAASENKQLDK